MTTLQQAYRAAAYRAKEKRLQIIEEKNHIQILQTRGKERAVIHGSAPSPQAPESVPKPLPTHPVLTTNKKK